MGKGKQEVTTFTLEGRAIAVAGKKLDAPKYLRLATATGEWEIKLAKEVRESVATLVPGSWVSVSGSQKFEMKKGKYKLKAYEVEAIAPTQTPQALESAPQERAAIAPIPTSEGSESAPTPKHKSRDAILVCQKSSCCKRGGKEVFRALGASLEARGLQNEVTLKATGCMGQCKKGPCVVFKADKERYLRVTPEQAADLVEKHCALPASVNESAEAELVCG